MNNNYYLYFDYLHLSCKLFHLYYLIIFIYLFPVENFSVTDHRNKRKFVQFHWLHSVKAVDDCKSVESKTDILKMYFIFFFKFKCKQTDIVILFFFINFPSLLSLLDRTPIAMRPVLDVEFSKKSRRIWKLNAR